MSVRLRKLAGVLLIFATVGVASMLALMVSCSSAAAAESWCAHTQPFSDAITCDAITCGEGTR